MNRYEIRPGQFAVLSLIRSNPGAKQQAICKVLGIQKANLVSVLDRLTERGLMERRPVRGDRRSSALHLTPDGEAAVKEMVSTHRALERHLERRLGPKRMGELIALLIAFCSAAE